MLSRTLTLLFVLLTSAGFWYGSLPSTGTITFSQVPIGAGGQVWVSGVIASDGTAAARTDTLGAYVRVAGQTKWCQVVTQALRGDIPSFLPIGAWDIAIAPNATTTVYIATNGYVYSNTITGYGTTNGCVGSTWHQTGFPRLSGYTGGGNTAMDGPYKFSSEKLVVDPANANVVYEVTNNNGTQRTFDGGANVAQVSDITASASGPGGAGIVFDPNSGTTTCPGGVGLCTNNIFVGVYGHGVWLSTDGGTSFSQITDGAGSPGPTNVWSAHMGIDGTYWAVDHSKTWTYMIGTGWTNLGNLNGSLGGSGFINAAIPNAGTSHAVVFFQSVGGFRETVTNNATLLTDIFGCSTWSSGGSQCASSDGITNISAVDIPWLSVPGLNASFGDGAYDPSNGTIVIGNGVGIFTLTVPVAVVSCFGSNTCLPTVTVSSKSVNVEEIVTRDAVAPPGGHLVIGGEDRPAFYIPSSGYPSSYGPNGSILGQGTGIDYSVSDPTFVCARAYDNIDTLHDSGCSTNGGNGSWSLFATAVPSDNVGGTVAVADHNNILVNTGQGGSGTLACTTDGGTTWVASHVSGGSSVCQGIPVTGWGGGYTGIIQNICSDKGAAGAFYGVYQSASNAMQVYTTSDLSSAFTKVYDGTAIGNATGGGNTRLRCTPGISGDLWFAGDMGQNNTNVGFLSHSTDSGATWTTITMAHGSNCTISSLTDFGFGAIAAGKTYPTLWTFGYGDCGSGFTLGIWRSTDFGVTWAKLLTSGGASGLPSLDFVYCVNGDMNDATLAYLCTGGGGAYQVKLNYLLKSDLDPAANDNSPAFLNAAA